MKKIIIIILVFLILGLAGGFFYFRLTHKNMKYTDWATVKQQFKDCQISAVDQTHGRLVNIILKDGTKEYVLEPEKNFVVDELVNALSKCGRIELKTK